MSRQRTRASSPDDLPATWYCRECAAELPRAEFSVRARSREDGSVSYTFAGRLCKAHQSAYFAQWNAQARRERRSLAEPRRPGPPSHEGCSAEEWAHRQERMHALARVVVSYVAGLWDETPAWLVARGVTPEQVEARALVVVILYDVHGWRIREAARVIERDRTTALYHLARYPTRPECAELLADYRQWRAHRKAAIRAARKAG